MALAHPYHKNHTTVQPSPNFVLLSCDKNNAELIMDRINRIPMVTDVKEIEGAYDILITLQSVPLDKVKQIIAEKIRTIPGIRTSLTLLGINPGLV